MTIDTNFSEEVFVGNGVATSFPCNIIAYEETYVFAQLYDTVTDIRVDLTLNVDYSVVESDFDTDPIVPITVNYPLSGSPLSATQRLIIVREVPNTQPTNIRNQAGFYPNVVEKRLDEIVMQIQQLDRITLRSVRAPAGDYINELPSISARAGKILTFDASGHPVATTLALLSSITASEVAVVDAGGYFTGTDVEAALQELGADIVAIGGGTAITPEAHGAVGDNATDDTVGLQAAEDAANALYVATGRRVRLRLTGTYLLSDSIIKRSGVDWEGPGAVKHIDYDTQPTVTVANTFALVYGNSISNFHFTDVNFFSITHATVKSNSLPSKGGTNDPGNLNSCLHLTDSTDWVVANCTFRGYSQGIEHRGCSRFQIDRNNFYDDSPRTIGEMLAGTYTLSYTYIGTGAIVIGYDAAGPTSKPEHFSITNNVIRNTGLDIAIECVNQTFDEAPGVVANNVIIGSRVGIQAYRGSFTDPGSAPTYDTRTIIRDNYIYVTWEQGIHLRGINSIRVLDNYLWSPGQGGSGGSLIGGIIARVNPMDTDNTAFAASRATVAENTGIDIINNWVVNVSRPGVASNGGINVRLPNTSVRNNRVVRDPLLFTSKADTAISLGGGEQSGYSYLDENIVDNFALGIEWAQGAAQASGRNYRRSTISENQIYNVNSGLDIDLSVPGPWDCVGNKISNATTRAMKIRNAPRGIISGNHIQDCLVGYSVWSGCLASNIPVFKDGIATSGTRRGSTLIFRDNVMDNVTTPTEIQESTTNDTSFRGRCLICEGNLVDGAPLADELSASSPSTSLVRTDRKGTQILQLNPATGVPQGWICQTAGNGGSAAMSTTGNVTNGSPTVTAIAAIAGFGPNTYVTIGGASYRILSVDSATQVTLGSNYAGATNTGEAITGSAAVWIEQAYVGASATTPDAAVNARTGTSETLALTDRGDFVTMSNASANTLNIPTNASVAFPIPSIVNVIQLGAGATTITAAGGVTLNGVTAGSCTLTAQHSVVSLVKIGTNAWSITGAHGTIA